MVAVLGGVYRVVAREETPMGTVILDMSVSLDGSSPPPTSGADEPLGVGWQVLHEWAMGADQADAEALAATADRLGALIAGRRTYDASIRWWGTDGLTGSRRLPLFVVTHRSSSPIASPTMCRPAACTPSSPTAPRAPLSRREPRPATPTSPSWAAPTWASSTWRRGCSTRSAYTSPRPVQARDPMFGDLGGDHVDLEVVEVLPAPSATHLRYRIVR